MRILLCRLRNWLSSLSFRSGMFVAFVCVICYAVSFAQMLLPISVYSKGVLWFIFFGMAKAAQYSALLIFGKAGLQRLRKYLSLSKTKHPAPPTEGETGCT